MVTLDTPVEEVLQVPGALAWCLQNRVSLFSCYGAFPSSLGRLLTLKGVADPARFVEELNRALEG